MERLQWSGKKAYNAAKKRDWHVGGKVAGWTKSAGDLTFATIYGAGHMVPMDRPEQSEAMFNAWIKGDPIPK
jgi:carboxypeptidase C (cathepsin A)